MTNVFARLLRLDGVIAGLALVSMALIPMVEMVLRPFHGQGIDNAAVLVQHLGLWVAMMGAVYAQRSGHLSSLSLPLKLAPQRQNMMRGLGQAGGAVVAGMLCVASSNFVITEMEAAPRLAYTIPLWWVQTVLPLGFAALAFLMSWNSTSSIIWKSLLTPLCPLLGAWTAHSLKIESIPLSLAGLALVALLLAGTPIFAILGGLGLLLLGHEGLPLASLALSHYQITVNPSLPALPLFTLAGLVLAQTQASQRLSRVFISVLGEGPFGTVLAVALLCTCFTALTGGSGVTILALGGLLLPLLKAAGYAENKAMGLVTSASALGVLLAPSVPLIIYAILARIPINQMFLAGVVPALVMVFFLIVVGGFLPSIQGWVPHQGHKKTDFQTSLWRALWQAKWEFFAPVVAIGSLVSGLTTPTESAALTAVYAVATQVLAHKELSWRQFVGCVSQTTQLIGGVMLIMGMALGLTNYLIDSGVPDLATEWVQGVTQNKYVFLLALNIFLFIAGALMEIYAAIVVLVPLLLPLAVSYGIDPIHFGIIFLANLEMGFLCPPAGMNIYFASAVFEKSLMEVVMSVAPAVLAIFLGTLLISWFPLIVMGLPNAFYGVQ